MNDNLKISITAAITAGRAIMEIYDREDFQIETKEDKSPLTIADKEANRIINGFLEPTGIPIISEENRQVSYESRRNWSQCWIVDPLDGTKEFIKRNGEFTVNIALVSEGSPVTGVIFAPALNVLYFGDVAAGKAHKVLLEEEKPIDAILEKAEEIEPSADFSTVKVVGSRSHMNEETQDFIQSLRRTYECEVEIVSVGSSLKFCLVAEGAAHFYPRFAPTMEWDTAAGQAICEAVGLQVSSRRTGNSIKYNRADLLNKHFFVSNEGSIL